MSVVPRQAVGREAWDAAVEASPDAWLWHRYDVCEATVRDWPGRSDTGFAVLSPRQEIEALVPAFVLERRAQLGLRIRHVESAGGPALSAQLGRSRRRETLQVIATELRRRARAAHASSIMISLPPLAPSLREPTLQRYNPLLHLGCSDTSGLTWITDLRPGADAVWHGLEGRVRTNVRKAEAAGMIARPSRGSDEWRQFHELHSVTYARLGVREYPQALFRTIFEQLIPADLCYVQFAELDGQVIAAHNIACYKQGGYFWHGFASEAGLHANALTFLWWQSVKDLLARGTLHWMDSGEAIVGGRADKMQQLSDFKRGFGGQLYPVYRGQIIGLNRLYNRALHLKGLISGR